MMRIEKLERPKKLILIVIMTFVCFSQNTMVLQAADEVNKEVDLAGSIEVEKIDMDFAGKDDKEISKMLSTVFTKSQFKNISIENSVTLLQYYKKSLITKATQQGLDYQGLGKCIDTLESTSARSIPVGAYLARLGQDDVWVIVSKTEPVIKNISGGGIAVDAIRVTDCSVIGSLRSE